MYGICMEVRIRAPKLLANLSNKSINTKNADPRMYQFLPECTELTNYMFKVNFEHILQLVLGFLLLTLSK